MKTIIKSSVILVVFTILLFIINSVFNVVFYDNYLHNNLFLGILMIIGTSLLTTFIVYNFKRFWRLFTLILILTLQSCNYAKSNQQVVISEDCGMNWKLINSGDAVPKGGLNMCYMKVVIPNYPMQGESKFISNLKDRVRASVHVDYDYSITDPLAFIKQAKYLGKANTSADSTEALNDSAFEGAENMVIDKRIKDVAKRIFLNEDMVELDQSDIEAKLLDESNKILAPLGVYLNFITLTFDLDEQTRQAIDVSTAMKIYQSKGLEEVGKQVMIERAGATKIIVENKTETIPVKD
ncbi:hypothetical protein D0817_20135 [Flavobacterium cupreum]|uniref:Band 7 domain-containing protein n=1 Tax=Flavobacterium cupreum TaxID=2133766 RepID=A0A434A2W0_9FLAO|nr:hypothetical protein [Flavobacterium cupreum]RUT68672.1 hypothetical protein D0817_20135 [Flavobacterium cupreum]